MNHPIINIEYNRFLDPIFIGWIQSQTKYKDWHVPAKETVLQKVGIFQATWKKHQERIFAGFVEATGLHFKRNHFDIHIVSGNPREFSFPIVLRSRHTESQFIQSITHELIHCLFKDNRISEDAKDPCPHNPHILVHAVLKFIYLDILEDPKLLDESILNSAGSGNSEYKEAWEFVQTTDYKVILATFRDGIIKK